jgi:cytochrome c-type biogenesis protein CcsB
MSPARLLPLLLTIAILLAAPPALSQENNAVPGEKSPASRAAPPPDVSAMADLVVLSRGRMKPLGTFASETLVHFFGTDRPLGKETLKAYASILFEPEAWLEVEALVPEEDLARRLFEGRSLLCASAVFEARTAMVDFLGKAEDMAAAHGRGEPYNGKEVTRDDLDENNTIRNQIMSLFDRAARLHNLSTEFLFLPDPESRSGEWFGIEEARAALDGGNEALRPGIDAHDGLRRSYLTGESAAFEKNLAALKMAQRGIAALPTVSNPVLSEGLVRFELLYYSVDFRKVGLAIFIAAGLFYILAAFSKKRAAAAAALFLFTLGILWNCWIVGGHTVIAGRLPLKNLQEVYLVVLFFVPLIGALLHFLLKNAVYSGMAAGLTVIGFVGSLFLPAEGYMIGPLVAILHSPWRQVHILTIMLSYAILLVAFGLHVTFLVLVTFFPRARTRTEGKTVYSPAAFDLNDKAYHMVAWGFLFLTIGIATGAAWGHSSWGRYWGWDPKEVWATVAWAIYALFLHLRLFFRTPKETLALINIIGYAAIIFTYFGVTYLLPGLHAYS